MLQPRRYALRAAWAPRQGLGLCLGLYGEILPTGGPSECPGGIFSRAQPNPLRKVVEKVRTGGVKGAIDHHPCSKLNVVPPLVSEGQFLA